MTGPVVVRIIGVNMRAGIIIGIILSSLWGWTVESRNVFVAAPNIFRLGAEEKIALATDGIQNREAMEVYIQDHPGKKRNFSHTTVQLSPGRPEIATLTIDPEDVQDMVVGDPDSVFYVSLVVHGAQFHKEAIIPLSIQSGYVYLQTDKPIYTPKQKVQFRIIALNEETKPTHGKLRLQIRNPKNVVVRDTLYSDKQAAKFFLTPEPFAIAAHPLFGNWSATVLYGHKFQQNSSAFFEVEKYVLPTFTVKLEVQEVILPTETVIPITVHATYLYGKPVSGIVTFRLGIKGPSPDATFFGIADSKKLIGGEYLLNVDTKDLKRHKDVGWFPNINGFHFIVEATVTDSATGLKEMAVDSKGIFTSSPLVISFKRCLKDFKPGLLSVIEADLTYVSGRPASGVKAVLSGTANGNLPLRVYTKESVSNDEGRIGFEIHPETHHTVINVEVKTADAQFGDLQSVGHHKQEKFTSKNNAYIAINRRSSETIQPGTSFSEDIYIENTGAPMTDIYFLIAARGRIIMMRKLPSGQFKNPRVEFRVTHEMAPSFRIMVFGHCNGELLADSRRVDVANICDPKSKVDVDPDFSTKEPGANGKIILRGNKGLSVGLLGVDLGVYALSDKGLLTKSKMFKALASHDLGCGPGGGLTTNRVLGNAGLIVMSNIHNPPQYSESSCKENIRKKRSLVLNKLEEYEGRLRGCCVMGMDKNLYDRTCDMRADVVKKILKEDDGNCSQVFHECCLYNEQEKIGGMMLSRIGPVAIGKEFSDTDLIVLHEDDEADLEKNVNVRKEFRETWIFTDIIIGPEGQAVHEVSLPHSITTWVIQAVSVSSNHGMCVADQKELKVMKKVFVQLNLPYSVVRNEQIEIKATVFNYGPKKLSAVVYMFGVKNLCSGSQEGEKSERKRLIVDAHSAQSVYFPIIPLKEGSFDIKVAALTPEGSDIVIRQLNVVPEGFPVEKHITVLLDPSNQQKREKRAITTDTYSDTIDDTQKLQVTSIKLRMPEDSIPGTESCVVSALGDQFGPTVETCLENPESLLSGPSGCAEQNMIYFAPTIYTMRYLKSTGKITAEKEERGYEFIRKGYGHQLTFRKNDGSFGAWITTPSSVWLTAFVTRVFCEASDLVYIDADTMCAGVTWLISKQKPEDGSFVEDHPVYHKDLMGGVVGKGPLTAYVLLTLDTCKCNVDTTIAKARAVDYLESILNTFNEPLPTAIAAYALAISNSDLKFAANDKLLGQGKFDRAGNTLHWSGKSAAASVEATSYALLTQLRLNDMDRSNSIVNWLNAQRYSSGRFESTQDTVVALNALSEYAIKAKLPGISLSSNITASNDRNFYKALSFDEKNAQVLQEVKVDKLGGLLFIHTAGHGVGLLSVKMRYNIPTPPEKLCKFDVTVNVTAVKEKQALNGDVLLDPRNVDNFDLYPDDLIRVKQALDKPPDEINYEIDPRNRLQRSSRIASLNNVHGDLIPKPTNRMLRIRSKREDKKENSAVILNVKICTKYLGNTEAGMSIVEAGVFSGFNPIEDDLKGLVKDENGLIDRYEVLGKGVVFYLRKVPRTESYCFAFRIMQDFIVGNIQTSVIKVYDYYNPEDSCTVFYRPDNNSPMLRKLCSNGICQCAEGGCPPKNPFFNISRSHLILAACESHDYVWKGKVMENVKKQDGFFRIKLQVQEVFKEGIETTDVVEGEIRTLLARDNCESGELLLNREYLIMGKDGEKYDNEKGGTWYRYMLDKSSKIQMWINMEKSGNSGSAKKVQRDLVWLSRKLTEKGCEL